MNRYMKKKLRRMWDVNRQTDIFTNLLNKDKRQKQYTLTKGQTERNKKND